MTDGIGSRPAGGVAVRALLLRAGHELRNAQSAASVNIEVIRSRLASGAGDITSLRSFAENAAKGLEEGAHLAESMIALCCALTLSLASGNDIAASDTEIEIPMPRESVERLLTDVRYLAERIGLGVEPTVTGVIFRIPPENETDRA